jgi:hypothetical protein
MTLGKASFTISKHFQYHLPIIIFHSTNMHKLILGPKNWQHDLGRAMQQVWPRVCPVLAPGTLDKDPHLFNKHKTLSFGCQETVPLCTRKNLGHNLFFIKNITTLYLGEQRL